MQKDYQHKTMACDTEDFCVFEMIDGEITYLTQAILEAAQREREQHSGGELKL